MCFFFFQAEDGIRDGHVTGVQTCALPICGRVLIYFFVLSETKEGSMQLRVTSLPGDGIGPEVTSQAICVLEEVATAFDRSEERRVGKECRCRWGPCHASKCIRHADYVGRA